MQNLPVEIKKQAETSGIEMTTAEAIASNYVPFMNQAQEQANLLKGLTHENEEDVKTAKRIRLDLGKICSAASKRKKEDKDILLVQTRYIDGLFKTVEGFARLTQKEAEAIEKHAEREKELLLDKVQSEREKKLLEFGVEGNPEECRNMSENVWKIYIKSVKEDFESRQKAEAEAERLRIEEERNKKIFDQRLKELLVFDAFGVKYDLTIETTEEEFQLILKSCEDAKKEAIEIQKNKQLHADRFEKLSPFIKFAPEESTKNLDKLSNKDFYELFESCEGKHKEEEKKRAEIEEKAKKAEKEAADLRKKEEARKKAEAEEKKRIEKENRAKEKAPDIEKLQAALNELQIDLPKFNDVNVAETATNILDKFQKFKDWAEIQITKIQ